MTYGFNLETGIFLGGLGHLGILSAGLVMTKVLNWETELKKINKLSAHVIWTHGAFIWFTILALGLVSVFFPQELTNGNPLGQSFNGFITLFWGTRLIIQFFYFDASPYLTSPLLKLGFHGLTVAFIYFTFIYGLAFYCSF